MMGCGKCRGICAVSLLAAGVLFLLVDLGYWDFWNIQWWTVMFILAGVGSLGMRSCPDCQAMMRGSGKK